MDDETYKFYLQDLCAILKEDAALAYLHRNESEMEEGIVYGYHHVLATIKNQFEAFGIDAKDLKMDDFNPDELLYDNFTYPLSDSIIELDRRGRKLARKSLKRV